MKSIMSACVVALVAGLASGDVYTDNVGNHLAGGDLHDFFASQGFNHLDIVSVGVTNDSSNLYFDIQLNADLDATNWGKYCVGINNTQGGPSNDGNGWGRNVNWGGTEITHWIGTWADDGGSGVGGQVWSYDGVGWNITDGLTSADASQHAAGRHLFSISLASLGVGFGDVVLFDVISTGGGNDPGVDHLSRFDYATDDWGVASVAGNFLAYTIVPAPSAIALFGLGGMAIARRRR